MSICDPGARVDETGLAYKGSMFQLQIYVNRFTDELNSAVADALDVSSDITWVSPLASAGYAEYRDEGFLQALGLERHRDQLTDFWPSRGPCWDGLALLENREYSPLLVEAKSYPREGYSSISAKSPTSLQVIRDALTATSSWVGLHERPDSWTDGRYQAANRLAHLYFLREVLGLEAHLVFVHFVGDPTHHQTGTEEWDQANSLMWTDLGFPNAPPYTGAVYLPGVKRDPASWDQDVTG